VQGLVKLDKDKKLAIWEPLSPISEGYYTFEITELIFEDGTKQETQIQIPIIVLDSKEPVITHGYPKDKISTRLTKTK
jgi:hypothetical protein